MPVRTPRRLAALLSLVALTVSGPLPAASASDAGAEARLAQLVNRARANAGVPGLTLASDLTAVARRHSRRMADQGRLHHNPGLRSETGNWEKVAENVGYGETADEVHAAFMGSAGHRSNILDAEYTQVGIGVERRGNTLWVTEVFRRPAGAADPPAPPPPAPDPPPAPPEPAPRARPAPAHTHAPAPPQPAAAPPPPPALTLVVVFARVEAEDSGESVGELMARAHLEEG